MAPSAPQVDPASDLSTGNDPFVNLHVRSDRSLLQSTCTVEGIVDFAAKAGQPGIAITDLSVVSAYPELSRDAKARGVKPIFGLELPVRWTAAPTPTMSTSSTVVLLAETKDGLHALERLSSAASTDVAGHPQSAAVGVDLLSANSRGLIALTGAAGTHLHGRLLGSDISAAVDHLRQLRSIFGAEGLFVQLGPGGGPEAAIRERAAAVARLVEVGVIASAPAVMLNAGAQALLAAHTCSATSVLTTGVAVPGHLWRATDMAEVEDLYPGALNRTGEIGRRCVGTFPRHGRIRRQPTFRDEGMATLRELAEEGLEARFESPSEEAQSRLSGELDAVQRTGSAASFLAVEKVARITGDVGALLGPGRGPAPGSLINYALGVTKVDPIKFGLMFERFSSNQRWAGLDLDCESRGHVLDELRRRPDGIDPGILEYDRRSLGAAVRLGAEALGQSACWADGLVKLLPAPDAHLPEPGLDRALRSSAALALRCDEDSEARKALDLARDLQGLILSEGRDLSANVVDGRIQDEGLPAADVDVADGCCHRVLQYSRATLEMLGLQIVDIFGLEALSVIREAQALARRSGVAISLDEIPTDDERSFELMGGSLTELPFVAVHPDLLRLTRPKNLTELAVLSGCSGPGHRAPLSRWTAARNQPELIDYPDERLEPILAETFGIVVFQEQIMQIAMSLGGISAGEADEMRRALGRKKRDQLRRWQDRFHAGALALGATPATAERVWSDYILKEVVPPLVEL